MIQNKAFLFLAGLALASGIGFAGYYSVSATQSGIANAQTPAAEANMQGQATVTAEQEEQPAAEILDITLSALREDPAAYDGKTLRIKGMFAGECADCTAFYFKDGVDTVETTIPRGFPGNVELGSKLEVIGTPWLKNTASSDKPYVKLVAERVTLVKE